MAQTRPRYVVKEIHWLYNDEWYEPDTETNDRAYLMREKAEARRDELEAERRRQLLAAPYPPAYDDPAYDDPAYHDDERHLTLYLFAGEGVNTSLSDPELSDRLIALGLLDEPDRVKKDGSYESPFYDPDWWVNAFATLGPDRADELWALLDGIRFYKVEEL
jgi:hypothetical protein